MCGHRKTHTKTEPQWLVLINKVIKLNKPQKNISQSESRFNESRKTHGMPYELNIKNQLSETNTKEYFKMCFLTFQQIYLVDLLVVGAAPKSCHHKHMYVWTLRIRRVVGGARRPNQKCLLQATQ